VGSLYNCQGVVDIHGVWEKWEAAYATVDEDGSTIRARSNVRHVCTVQPPAVEV